MAGVVSAATGNYYTATDIQPVANADCGGTVGFYCSRPEHRREPECHALRSGHDLQYVRLHS